MLNSISLLLGIVLFTQKQFIYPSNLEILFGIILLTLSIFIYKNYPKISRSILVFMAGFVWAFVFSIFNTNHIDEKYHNNYISAEGFIVSLVETNQYRDSFLFQTEKPFNAKIKLSLYGKNRPKIHTGEKWQFSIKLKDNNSLQNLASFDYEKWLFAKGIDFTGYINISKPYKFIGNTNHSIINQWRTSIRKKLLDINADKKYYGIINAVVIGDKSLISNDMFDVLANTNTTHLSVISGLHIGIIASLMFLISNLIFSRLKLINIIPIMQISACFAIIFAILYAAIAGFSTPTIRASIMLVVFMLGIIFRKSYQKWQLYNIALFAVLIINPLSVLTVGFWLSFLVVAIIIYVLISCSAPQNLLDKIKIIFYIQLVITIFMTPILLLFFQNSNLLSPFANIIAIPVFSIIVVPFSLFATFLVMLQFDFLANIIFHFVDIVLQYLFNFLNFLISFNINYNYFISDKITLFAAVILVILLLSPRPLKLRFFAIIILVALIIKPNSENNHLHFLDVGQGLSLVFINNNNTLLYDTGNIFQSGFNMGDSVINPFLLAKNITKLDKIIISHDDSDHIGGLNAVLAKHQVKEIIVSKKIKNSILCNIEKSWKWGEWQFKLLTTDGKFTGNNASCVLKIFNNKYSFLLTGDIEKQAEKYLIQKYGKQLQSDILLAPHHGSKTSSSINFLKAVSPKTIIISSGYQNRFNHPARQIIDRYKKLGINFLSTACSGQISINLNNLAITEYRKDNHKYYHRLCKNNL